MAQIRREVTLTPGPVVVRGNVASRNKKKKKFADYVLYKSLGFLSLSSKLRTIITLSAKVFSKRSTTPGF